MGVNDKKKFIILQEDDKGFSFNNKKPSGYVKIENRDLKFKIFYYVQNIDNQNTYNLNLIINNDSKIEVISIGEIKSDNNGKIEVSYDFDENMLDSVCGGAICVKTFKGDLKFPVSGFLPKKKVLNWKVSQTREVKSKYFKKDNNYFESTPKKIINKEESSNDEEIKNLPSHDNDLNKFENDGSEKLNSDECLNVYEKYEKSIKNIIDDSKESYKEAEQHISALKKLLIKDDGKIEKMLKSLLPNLNDRSESINSDYNYRFFFNVLSDFDEVNSLNYDGYVFFRVNVNEFSQLREVKKNDNVKYAVVYYPMICMYPYFKDKGYFIIGLNYDCNKGISNLVYGVEVDDGMENLFPYDGHTGFNKYIYDYENSKGYHIMEYDYKECVVK